VASIRVVFLFVFMSVSPVCVLMCVPFTAETVCRSRRRHWRRFVAHARRLVAVAAQRKSFRRQGDGLSVRAVPSAAAQGLPRRRAG
jgi:hypothetical protein